MPRQSQYPKRKTYRRSTVPRGYIRGHGDYKSFFRGVGRAIQTVGKRVVPKGTFARMGNAAGAFAGSRFGGTGAKIGSALGDSLGSRLSSLVGFGDYRVKKNSLMDEMSSGGGGPPIINNGLRSNIVRHREYIGDVLSSATAGAFSLSAFPLNPGLSSSFPWLSSLAQNYEEYQFRGMIWEFKSTSADALNSTNTALGTIILSTEYNVLNAQFSNKQQMENAEFASSAKPSECVYHPIECDPRQTPVDKLFVRSGPVVSSDLRFSDLGTFQIASVGCQGTSVNLGELWVSYEVELFKPVLVVDEGLGGTPMSIHWTLDHANFANAHPWGSTTSIYGGTSGNLLGTITSGTTITLSNLPLNANFIMVWTQTGTTASITNPTFSFTNGLSNANGSNPNYFPETWLNDGSTLVTSPNGVSTTVYFAVLTFVTTNTYAGSGTITVSTGGTLPSSPSSGDIFITQVSDTITA